MTIRIGIINLPLKKKKTKRAYVMIDNEFDGITIYHFDFVKNYTLEFNKITKSPQIFKLTMNLNID